MRYRSLSRSGAAVSCISLVLGDHPGRPDEKVKLVYAALEAGVNTFELQSREPAAAEALGQALSVVERNMVFVALKVGWNKDRNGRRVRDFSADGLTGAIETMLARTGLDHLDVAILDARDDESIPDHVIPVLRSAQAARRVNMLGIAGSDGADPHIGTGVFDVLVTPFNIQSGWRERNRLKHASQADMAVIGCAYNPLTAEPDAPTGQAGFSLGKLLGGGRKDRHEGAYAFLERTPAWSAEEICLGYALTEPALATVQVGPTTPAEVQALAEVAERDLPNGVAAQIEMARFSETQASGAA
jgi:aryl-alcohol dehydrogenase-like predicted oxidoreductase